MIRILWLVAAALVFPLASCSMPAGLAAWPDPRIGKPAPDFALPTLTGETVRVGDLRGQVVLINFWGTFCPPCVEEMPDLQRLYETYGSADFTILAVNVEERPSVVESFRDRLGLTFPILLSRDASVNPTFNIRAMPTSWLVDRDGIVRYVWVGSVPVQQAKGQIQALLGPDSQ